MGIGDGEVVEEEVGAGAEGVGAGLMGEVIDELVEAVVACVGEPERVPKEATPEMLTAGPMGSLTGAWRLLLVNWPRVSFTVRGVMV